MNSAAGLMHCGRDLSYLFPLLINLPALMTDLWQWLLFLQWFELDVRAIRCQNNTNDACLSYGYVNIFKNNVTIGGGWQINQMAVSYGV
ncbi:MAG: hypothetical protein HQK96_02535 [Nitrospirae bacterium]|nr:hypothetical protein [Nitrospirota bacterium]